MPVQSFNPTASPNGPVGGGTSGIGSQGEASGLPGSGGRPSGVVELSGTDNLRAEQTQKSATDGRPEAASSSEPKPPQKFGGTSV